MHAANVATHTNRKAELIMNTTAPTNTTTTTRTNRRRARRAIFGAALTVFGLGAAAQTPASAGPFDRSVITEINRPPTIRCGFGAEFMFDTTIVANESPILRDFVLRTKSPTTNVVSYGGNGQNGTSASGSPQRPSSCRW
jgi:hypothetical protein